MTNIFTNGFDTCASVGDTITAQHEGFTLTARIEHDDTSGAPDKEMDGFWPSLDPMSAGYIGPKSKSTLRRHMARAQMVMDAWRNDEWFWCGIVVSVARDGVDLGAASLWSVACNYPENVSGRPDNFYLLDVANEWAGEALKEARAKLASLCANQRPSVGNNGQCDACGRDYEGPGNDGKCPSDDCPTLWEEQGRAHPDD